MSFACAQAVCRQSGQTGEKRRFHLSGENAEGSDWPNSCQYTITQDRRVLKNYLQFPRGRTRDPLLGVYVNQTRIRSYCFSIKPGIISFLR